MHYPYKLLNGVDEYGGVGVSGVLDIGCTKLQTISARGSKKDFVDLFCFAEILFERVVDSDGEKVCWGEL